MEVGINFQKANERPLKINKNLYLKIHSTLTFIYNVEQYILRKKL
jgi:hypothetical protein